jgi:hypothetical protein
MGIMGICLECNEMAEYGICIACNSNNVRQASYDDLTSRGMDPWYAVELTGDTVAANKLMEDIVFIVEHPHPRTEESRCYEPRTDV